MTAKRLERLGRISGYLLDYGTPFSDSPAVSEIQTEVERYRTPAEARKGLGFWRKQELDVRALKAVRPPRLLQEGRAGARSAPLLGVSQHRQDPRAQARLCRRCRDRRRRVPAGRLDRRRLAGGREAARPRDRAQARPTVPPRAGRAACRRNPSSFPRRKPGPPAHGAKPGRLALTRSDLGSPATIRHAGYVSSRSAFDEYSISAYDLALAPAGSAYDELAAGGLGRRKRARGEVLRGIGRRRVRARCRRRGYRDTGRPQRRRRQRLRRARPDLGRRLTPRPRRSSCSRAGSTSTSSSLQRPRSSRRPTCRAWRTRPRTG